MQKGIAVKRPIVIKELKTAFIAERGKGYAFRGESHDFWEIVYIKKGIAGFTAQDKIFECPPDTLVFHRPNEFHRIWNAGEDEIEFTVISFATSSEYMLDALSGAVLSLSGKTKRLMQELRKYIVDYRVSDEHFPVGLEEPANEVALARFCSVLELLLYECAVFDAKIAPKSSYTARLFADAVRIMNEQLSRTLTSREIAESLNVSQAHLKRIFRRYALSGVHEYFLAMKIEKAKSLLLQGESVASVADQVGFDHPNYFSLTFKRLVGTTPTRWLKNPE